VVLLILLMLLLRILLLLLGRCMPNAICGWYLFVTIHANNVAPLGGGAKPPPSRKFRLHLLELELELELGCEAELSISEAVVGLLW